MIKTVVDQMLVHEQNPTRATCHTIARMIVRDWPKSFADVGQKGDMLGDGCYSLLQQIKTRVEYKNRKQTLQTRRRRNRRPSNVAEEGAIAMARGPVDQYGCVRWSVRKNFLLERRRQPWKKKNNNYWTSTQREGWEGQKRLNIWWRRPTSPSASS